MARQRLNPAKPGTKSTLRISDAHLLFVEDNNSTDMKNNLILKNVHPTVEKIDFVNNVYCDSILYLTKKSIY